MKRILVLMIATLIFCVASFSQTGGAKGKVKAPNGKGLSQVSVIALLNGIEAKRTLTNEKGDFLLNGLSEEIYSFVFEKQGFDNGALKRMQILSGQIRDLGNNLVLKISDNSSYVILRASVLDQDGRSVRGAKVEISKVNGDKLQKLKTVYTDEAGEIAERFPDQTATFRLTAYFPKAEPVSENLSIEGSGIYHKLLKIKTQKKEEPQQP